METLPEIEVAFGETAGVGAGDERGRHVAVAVKAAVLARELSQLEHPPGPLEVDVAGLVEPERERDRGGAVDDRGHPLGEPDTFALRQAKARRGHVGGERVHPVLVLAGAGPEQVLQDPVDAGARGLVALGAHQRDDPTVASLQVARQQLHADETGGSGQQNVAGACARHACASESKAHMRRSRVSHGSISSSTKPRAAATSGRSWVSA